MEAIVIGADHYNTLWVIRTLGFERIRPYVIIYDEGKYKSYVLKSQYIKEGRVVSNVDSVIWHILEYSSKCTTLPFLFITDDMVAENIDKKYDELKNRIIVPSCEKTQGRMGFWMNKWNMNEVAKEVGFNIPITKEIDLTKDKVKELPDNYFPCILKPLKSLYGTKYDVRICNNNHDYITAVQQMKGRCDHYIVQEFIHPDFELTINGVRSRKADCTLFPGVLRKDRTCNSVYNLGMVTLAHLETDIKKYIDVRILTKFLKRIDYDGLCSFDLFVKNNKTYFLEANLRTDGDMFIYTTAGVNLPKLWMLLQSGENINDFECRNNKNIYGMIETSYLKYANWLHPFTIIKDWWRTDCYSIFSWKDMKPFVYKIVYAL